MSTLLAVLVVAVFGAPNVTAELSRLVGHDVVVATDKSSYTIRSIADEGKPLVGVVTAHDKQLWLVSAKTRYRLSGPLAIPRIAGPGYKVWVLGDVRGRVLVARRLGVLAPPSR